MDHDQKKPIEMTVEQIRQLAAEVAEQLKETPADSIPSDLRRRFIDVRAALFQRGIYDPVLVRFDTITVSRASTAEIAEQLLVATGAL